MENPRTRETGQEENKLYYSYQCLIQCNLHWFIKKKEKGRKNNTALEERNRYVL